MPIIIINIVFAVLLFIAYFDISILCLLSSCARMTPFGGSSLLDNEVGYSPLSEDLLELDIDYVNPDSLDDLPEKNLNIMHLNIRGLLNK